MARTQHQGRCEHCGSIFQWYLVHNGFNNSCHAYCSDCGQTAIISLYAPEVQGTPAQYPGEIMPELEGLLKPCKCAGHFVAGAKPRCPSCKKELSAEAARKDIESALPGTKKGWRWQGTWNGIWALYCIIINDSFVSDVLA